MIFYQNIFSSVKYHSILHGHVCVMESVDGSHVEAPLAQLVEYRTLDRGKVASSNLIRGVELCP